MIKGSLLLSAPHCQAFSVEKKLFCFGPKFDGIGG